MTKQQEAAIDRQCGHENLIRELTDALDWAMSMPAMGYARRLKQNAIWCDKVDAARELIARAKEQA